MEKRKEILTAAIIAALTLAACQQPAGTTTGGKIQHPITEHLTGTWQHSRFERLDSLGQWVDETDQDEGYTMTYTYRADSTLVTTVGTPEGWQRVVCCRWQGDDEQHAYLVLYTGGAHLTYFLCLNDSQYVVSSDATSKASAYEPELGSFRYTYTRQPDMTYAEKMVGRWQHTATQERTTDGQWSEAPVKSECGGWLELLASGVAMTETAQQDTTGTVLTWQINPTTERLRLTRGETVKELPYKLPSPDTLEIYHSNAEDGGRELRDVMVRVE